MSLALLMSAAAHAQTTQLNVTVPFDFIAGDTVLPAGDYDVQSTDTLGRKSAFDSQCDFERGDSPSLDLVPVSEDIR